MRGDHKIEDMGDYVNYENIKFVDNLSALASSKLRIALTEKGDISPYVDNKVLKYIVENNLYVE